MANFTLSCVDIHYQAIIEENAEGQVVNVPSGETFSAMSGDDTMFTVAIGVMPAGAPTPGVPARVITPVRQPRTGDIPVAITVSSTGGETPWVDDVTLGADTVPTEVLGDPNNVFLVTQPLPPA